MAQQLLAYSRVDMQELVLLEVEGDEAVRALRQSQVDVVMMVAPPDSQVLRDMLSMPGVRLANLQNLTAMAAHNPTWEPRLLARGALGSGQPLQDITLPVTVLSLVAREDLHPALKRLATAVAKDVRITGGLFHRANDFPPLRRMDSSAESPSDLMQKNQLPLLERFLPFWWAQLFERLLLIVLPLALATAWLMQLLPDCLRWALESRLNRWNRELRCMERGLDQEMSSGLDLTRLMLRLNEMDKALLAFACPSYLIPRCCKLHHHIDAVRQRLYQMRGR